ncbi:MAG: ABC transporter ATP-binding protein [Armatimonadota bacterium]|nr:ABC transporter ATP-binding protein [Armatimonadota bacterium]MDR7460379.1 ABC transporter ATP-binding protein [Armatimonadota bacterium]MDR7480535.1 ABC transporter ATP-binding protein [Armatimonadota bacterium]MDR7489158.1 ABC transporter ATP-binding protein [Armatimonadota bacterium]MDR7490999.1 ABC transporter ATP-binding protein [Armatimonadota bacterium]
MVGPAAPPGAPAIEVEGLRKVYVDQRTGEVLVALDDVSLTVEAGAFVSLIGPSGCGKTTLLKIIDGLVSYDAGTVRVQGAPVRGPGPDRAVVFQSFALLPWLTVRENVAFGLRLQGAPEEVVRERCARFIAMVGLRGFEEYYPRQLSGGMQQRVGLARALAVDPAILLMDEPFGSLDAQTRHLLQLDLERIRAAVRKTVLFVTHAMDEAVFLSDRVVILTPRPGRVREIVRIDLPRPRTDATRQDPRFVALTGYIWEVLRTMLHGGPLDREVPGGAPAMEFHTRDSRMG